MLLAYLDESYTDNRYYMGAVLVPEAMARPLTQDLDEIVARAVAGVSGMTPEAELHAYEIVSGKKAWAPLRPGLRARIGVYHAAIQAVRDRGCSVILRGVDVDRLNQRYSTPEDAHGLVLGHLIERINDFAQDRDEQVLMIADEIDLHDTYRRNLWYYQRNGTWGYRARAIDRIVDTLHFAPSSASRLLQAADLATYLYRRRNGHEETDPRAEREWDRLWERIAPAVQHARCWVP